MATKPKSKTTVKTRPPFDAPSAKNLLSQWMLADMDIRSLSLKQKHDLFLNTLSYILDNEELVKQASSLDFSKKQLEKLLHQTAG